MMKQRVWIIALLAGLGLLSAVACKGKETATLTLDAGEGGTISSSAYEVGVGESLFEFLKDISPTPEAELDFAGWYLDGKPLSESERMPEEGLTLTAKYYAEYTVNVCFEETDGSYSSPETSKGRAFYGEPFSYEQSVEHFLPDEEHEGSRLSSEKLGKGEVFQVYYARESYSVVYYPNAPTGFTVSGRVAPFLGKYGQEATLNGAEGYAFPARCRFAGWSEDRNGEAQYAAGDSLPLDKNYTLYAVWDVGFADRFGGADVIFTPRAEEGVALLVRGGTELRGTLEGETFTFLRPDGERLSGRLYADDFAYFRTDVSGVYTLLRDGESDADITLTVDEYGNATYRNGSELSGILAFDQQIGDWCFLRENGAREFRCRFFETEKQFELGGEEAGDYIDVYYTGNGDALESQGLSLFLDGYGVAVLGGTERSEGTYRVSKSEPNGEYVLYAISALFDGEPLDFYTLPLEGGVNGFLLSDGSEGEYEGEGTLSLDGFGIFSDSAVYTDSDGVRHAGGYSLSDYFTVGTVISLTEGGRSYLFLLEQDSFTLLESASELPLYELRRVRFSGTYSFIDPLLVLYGDETDEGFRAELYTKLDNGAYKKAGEGRYSEEQLGYNLYLSTFTLSHAEEGADLPQSFSYLVGGIRFENTSAEVYFVLEWDGEKQYTVWHEQDGSGEIWAHSLPMGSLYFAPDGNVYQGTISNQIRHEDFDDMRTFTFTYLDFSSMRYSSFDCEYLEQDGGIHYTVLDRAPINLFLTDGHGVTEIFASLALDGRGNALYLGQNGEVRATYSQTDMTVFGDNVYTILGQGVSFSFIMGTYYDFYSDTTYDVYYRYDKSRDGTFLDENGASLQLDGYYRASFRFEGIDYRGTCFLSDDDSALYFVSENSDEFYFLLDGENLTVLGAEYGVWDFVDDSYADLGFEVTFDGLGSVSFQTQDRLLEGTYQIVGEYANLPQIRIFGIFSQPFVVSFMKILTGERYCVTLNGDAYGSFLADDWTVLVLDGYGYGVYFGSDGSAGRRGIYTVYDGDRGRMQFRFSDDYSKEFLFVADKEKMTFRIQSFSDYSFYADDFSGIRFDGSGYLYLLGEVGRYFVDNGSATAYFLEDGNSYSSRQVFAPSEAGGVYLGKQFRLWNGEEIRLSGKIEFRDGEGELMPEYPTLDATASFLPDGNPRFSADAVLTADGETYRGFSFEISYLASQPRAAFVYDGTQYSVSFSGTERNFLTVGGASQTIVNDAENSSLSYASLTMSAFGFGPIHRIEPTVKGDIHYVSGSRRFDFSFSVPQTALSVVGYDPEYGDRYLLRFEQDGTQYAMTYYLSYGSYYLHCLATYAETASENFTVGVLRYLYDSGNFSLPSAAQGSICGITLREGDQYLKEYSLDYEGNNFAFVACNSLNGAGRAFLVRLNDSDGRLSATVTEQISTD